MWHALRYTQAKSYLCQITDLLSSNLSIPFWTSALITPHDKNVWEVLQKLCTEALLPFSISYKFPWVSQFLVVWHLLSEGTHSPYPLPSWLCKLQPYSSLSTLSAADWRVAALSVSLQNAAVPWFSMPPSSPHRPPLYPSEREKKAAHNTECKGIRRLYTAGKWWYRCIKN